MVHSSESWLVGRKNELALSRVEMRMVRQMCGVKLSAKIACHHYYHHVLVSMC